MQKFNFLKTVFLLCALIVGSGNVWAEEFTFTPTAKDAGTLASQPTGVTATFNNTYDNAYQVTSSRSMTLTISGLDENIKITGIKINAKTNKSAGAGTAIAKMNGTQFGSYTYTVIGSTYTEKSLDVTPTIASGDLVVIISCTTNSVYCNKFTFTYELVNSSLPNASVSTTSLAFGDVEVGQTKSKTFTVTPANLTGDLTIESDNSKYTVSPSKIDMATTTATTITVTAAPTALDDDMDGSITISGGGIKSKTVSLLATPYQVANVTLSGANGTFTSSDVTISENAFESRVGSTATVTAKANSGYKFTGWTATGATPASSSNATQEFTFTSTSATLTATFEEYNAIEYDFTKIDLTGWSSYEKRVVEYTDATVTFASAMKQSSTITDRPVTKGGDVTLVLKNAAASMSTVSFECKQWTTKEQTMSIQYSTDGGKNYTDLSPAVSSTNFSIVASSLPTGTNAVKLKFSSTSNQVGITSAAFEYAPVSVTISSAGYKTYYSANALKFEGVDGLKAYIAEKDGTTIKFTQVSSVPAETGVLLKGDAATYQIPVVASSDTNVSANKLEGVLEDTAKDAGIFVLMNGTSGVGFYKTTSAFTVGANTAYLPASVAGAKTFIGFDDEALGISDALKLNSMEDKAFFNLAGQRVEQPTKGLYIVGGKKVIIK